MQRDVTDPQPEAPIGTSEISGPAGPLEAIHTTRSSDGSGAALICHPHPEHGGTMHNKVVYRAAKALESAGFATLRFNFRGVGRSAGTFDEGIGEADDVRAALDWLAAEHAGAPITLAGFSFGNVVGLPVGADDDRVTRLIGLGTPTDRFPFERLAESTKPKLFVQGSRDEYGPADVLRARLSLVAQPWSLVVIDGGDHFFEGLLPEMQQAIVDFAG